MQWNGARMLDFIFASQDCKLQGNWRFEHSTMVCPRTQIKLYIPAGHKRPLWCEYYLKLLDLHGQIDTKNHQPFLARLIPFWAFPICFVESNCVHPIVNTCKHYFGDGYPFQDKKGMVKSHWVYHFVTSIGWHQSPSLSQHGSGPKSLTPKIDALLNMTSRLCGLLVRHSWAIPRQMGGKPSGND